MSTIKHYDFAEKEINNLAVADKKEENWPVVYQIYNNQDIYIGETTNLKSRMRQHHDNPEKATLRGGHINVVFDDTFNKSVALDLESYLIQYFSGDGKFNVVNRNDGMCDRDYYNRENYRAQFEQIWENLRKLKIADHSIAEIQNSELFKFSPYKNLNLEQLETVTEILLNIDEAIAKGSKSLSVIDGDAGTGKTIVITYLAKLLADLQTFDNLNEATEDESNFKDFFEKETFNRRFKNLRMALVIPQTSLRGRIQQIFDKIDLRGADIKIFSPITFAASEGIYDITMVDEAHLLKVGASGMQAGRVHALDRQIFGNADLHTEFDWIMAKSRNVVMVYSEKQRIRPLNIDNSDIEKYAEDFCKRTFYLRTQMRSHGGKRYIDYINEVFSNDFRPVAKEYFPNFEAKIFLNFKDFLAKIHEQDEKCGLARAIAGFAWEWKSRPNRGTPNATDIVIDGIELQWNQNVNNWIGSKNSVNEIGSIYTVQGDDLNYAGVIIGKDLIYRDGRLVFDPNYYYDSAAAKRNSRQIAVGYELDENDMLDQILRVYRILLNRAVKGVYLYVCDDELRGYLSQYFDIA